MIMIVHTFPFGFLPSISQNPIVYNSHPRSINRQCKPIKTLGKLSRENFNFSPIAKSSYRPTAQSEIIPGSSSSFYRISPWLRARRAPSQLPPGPAAARSTGSEFPFYIALHPPGRASKDPQLSPRRLAPLALCLGRARLRCTLGYGAV